MKKYAKILLVLLAATLLAATVFSTIGAASSDSASELDLVAKAEALRLTRKVEDFTDESVLIQDSIIPGEEYEESSSQNSLDSKWVNRTTATNSYGIFSTVDSKTTNRYARLLLEKAYTAEEVAVSKLATYMSAIQFNDKQAFAKNDYLIYEWDMTTETQYPVNFSVVFQNSNSTAIGDSIDLITGGTLDGKVTIGGVEYDLGAAGTWNHFTVVMKITGDTSSGFGESEGLLFLNGEKVLEFDPVLNDNKSREQALRIQIGYYKQTREGQVDNTSICVDNVVTTRAASGFAGTENDLLQNLFAAENPVTDLTLLQTDAIVYNADYELPFEPALALYNNDGTVDYLNDFAKAYEQYKLGGVKYIALFESQTAAIDSPVVLELSEGVTFTDTTPDEDSGKYACVVAESGDVVYYTFTKETEKKLTIQFYSVHKDAADGTAPALTATYGVGVIPTVPEEFAPVSLIPNTQDPDKIYSATGEVELYYGDEQLAGFPLVTEAMLSDGEPVYSAYPVYELKNLAYEVSVPASDGTVKTTYYLNNTGFAEMVETAPNNSTITLRSNTSFDAKMTIESKTLFIDLAGKSLYQGGEKAVVPFSLEAATLYLYSSREGGNVYCGHVTGAAALINVSQQTTGNAVHIGYANAEEKDAYVGNLTVHAPSVIKNVASGTTVSVYGIDVKVVGTSSTAYGIFELSGSKCKNVSVSIEQLTIYNTENQNNILSFSGVGKTNTVSFKDVEILNADDSTLFANVIGTLANASTQAITLENVVYYGTLAGSVVTEENILAITVVDNVKVSAYDPETVVLADGTKVIQNNKAETVSIDYTSGGIYSKTQANDVTREVALPTLKVVFDLKSAVEDFCEVEWYFSEDIPSIKEMWVRGVVPEFRGEYPVSAELLTYVYDPSVLVELPADATSLRIEAQEVADIALLGLAQNISISLGMKYNLYIPVAAAVESVVIGERTVTKEDMTLTEDGAYYIVVLDVFTLRNLPTATYTFTLNLKTKIGGEFTLESTAVVLDYFRSLYENEEVSLADKNLATAFLKYASSAGEYLGVDVSAVSELIAGKSVSFQLIDGIVDEGMIRYGIKGVRLNLVEVPQFVFYIRDTFSGTITIGTQEYTVVDGKCGEEIYLVYTPESYITLGQGIDIHVVGTVAEKSVDESGAFALANYLVGIREELGSTPSYVLDLYQFYALANAIAESDAENPEEDFPSEY